MKRKTKNEHGNSADADAPDKVATDSGEGRRERVVKRYANRKLYDTADSRYVTLEEIADLIRTGEDLRVVDNVTGEDLTSVTLSQIILGAERNAPLIPLGTLRDVIRTRGQALTEMLRGRFGGDRGADEAPGAGNGDATTTDGSGPLDDVLGVVDNVGQNLEKRVSAVLQNLDPFHGMRRRLSELTTRVALLEGRLAAHGIDVPPAAPASGEPTGAVPAPAGEAIDAAAGAVKGS